MKATETLMHKFLSQADTQFIIPVYQRNYDWTRVQCKQLIDDILKAGSSPEPATHFIGSLVFIHDDVYTTGEVTQLTIIDGQQRITTLTLIYLILCRKYRELKDQQAADKIYKKFLINEFQATKEKLKLRATANNDKAFLYLLEENPSRPFSEFSRVIENYNYLYERIVKENMETISRGLNKLLFVEVSLERRRDDPQKIFESLNSTGLELSQADLIRNYILMDLKPEVQTRLYREYWQPIEQAATHLPTNTNKVSEFIRDFLTLENKKIPNKSRVYQEFKESYTSSDWEAMEAVLKKLKRFAGHYHKLINPDQEPEPELARQLACFIKLDVNVVYPFLLKVYDDYKSCTTDKQTILEVTALLQSYIWRRFILGLPTNALNKIFMRLHEELNSEYYLSSLQAALLRKKGNARFPDDAETFAALKEKDVYNIKPKNRLYFLEKLENHNNREWVKIEGNPDLSIEHIFPQAPHPQWRNELNETDFREMQKRYLHTIANLTLSGNNGALGNKAFTTKRDMNVDGREQGYKYSRLWLNRFLAKQERWDVTLLQKRFELIVKRFSEIWQYPELDLPDQENSGEVNIFDAEDPTHKKLDYIIFMDEKVPVSTVSEMYQYLLQRLFELSPVLFFNTDLAEKLGITKEKENLREAARLDETYYYERNFSSKHKFERLKEALMAAGCEEDLYIMYADSAREMPKV